MSYNALNESERERFKRILIDLDRIFEKQNIDFDEIDGLLSSLKSEEVKTYIKHLQKGSKPEAALSDAFFAGRSILSSYLASKVSPEINVGPGFIDYQIGSGSRSVLLELKSLFESETRTSKAGREITGLKQKPLKWEDHQDQILKYIRQGGEFIVITNLKEWYFFNDNVRPDKCEPFFHTDLLTFVKEYDVVNNLIDYLERHDFQAVRENLDKEFFESLKSWVKKLNEVEYDVDERTKVSLIMGIINKFIFVQTLDDYGIVDFRWLKNTWDRAEKMWRSKGRYKVLESFFNDVLSWFYEFYDTELFRGKVLEFIRKDEANIEKFYENLQLILGLVYWQTALGGYRGIMQYNFRYIDEDIFGKAYETFLAEVRHDEGIYYTPSYITEYIVENTVGRMMDGLCERIEKCIEANKFEDAVDLVNRFTSVKVLDPACGSGSFLVKATKKIMKRYQRLRSFIEAEDSKINHFDGTLKRAKEVEDKVAELQKIKKLLRVGNSRELISAILLRHICGNDLDSRALEVAKVNLWLEGVKLAPADFRYEKLPSHTNRILPDLELNLNNGDAVVGLPFDLAIHLLAPCKSELAEMSRLRDDYMSNPTKPELVEKTEAIRSSIRLRLDQEFEKYINDKKLPVIFNDTKILHWPLEFWYLCFDGNGDILSGGQGADVVIGNPPYERIQVLQKKSPKYVDYLNKAGFKSATKNYDLAVVFIERGYDLTRGDGKFGYIVTNKFMQSDYGAGIRSYLSQNNAVEEIVDFGDQQVFDNATTYTAMIFLSKSKHEKVLYSLVKKLEKTFTQLDSVKQSTKPDTIVVMDVDSVQIGVDAWVFASKRESGILKKFEELPTLGDIAEKIFVGLQTSADPIYIVEGSMSKGNILEIVSKKQGKKYLVEKDLFKPILMGKDVKRWFVSWRNLWLLFPYRTVNGLELIDEKEMQSRYTMTWKYLLEHKPFLDERENGAWKNRRNWHAYVYEKNLEMFSKPKLLTQVLSNKCSFAYDESGTYYFVGGGNAGVYGITIKPKIKISFEYLIGLLNGSLLDYRLRKKSSKFHGGYYSYAKRFIEGLPIKVPENAKDYAVAKTIESLVKEILFLRLSKNIFSEIWKEWSDKLGNNERTLMDLLKNDSDSIRFGDSTENWFTNVSFYPDKARKELDEEYDDFEVVGNTEDKSILIIGFKEDSEKEVFRIQSSKDNLLEHVYLSLVNLLNSRAKVQTLQQIFEKTVIPVIQPNLAKNTQNIFAKVIDEYKLLHKQGPNGMIELDAKMEEAEAKVDALVFKIYHLNVDEIMTVMTALPLRPTYRQKVIQYLKE